MWTKTLVLWALVTVATAQIPSFGWCPDYQAMANFNMNRFLGMWHEAERYFTVTELGSRCVTTTYDKLPDGRVFVYNEIRSALTGVKRVIEGQLQHVGRDGEGKLSVKYLSLPLPYDTHYTILDTDYDTFAVMWSCSGIGPVHTQNAWVMTRDRLPPNLVLQRAYGVLDKYKISRAFFVKTGQDDCTVQPQPIETIDPSTVAPDAKPAAAAAAPAARDALGSPDLPKEVQEEEKPQVDQKQEVAPIVKSAFIEPAKAPLPVAEFIISNLESKKVDAKAEEHESPKGEAKAIPVPESHAPVEAKKVNNDAKSESVPENAIPLVKSIVEAKEDEHKDKSVEPQKPIAESPPNPSNII